MHSHASLVALAGIGAVLMTSCSGSGGSAPGSPPPGSGGPFDVVDVSNGFGLLLPHQVHALDSSGMPTPEILAIRSEETLFDHVTDQNPILTTPVWPDESSLPSGEAGNHFIAVRFDGAVDVTSVLRSAPGGPASGLGLGLNVVALDPVSGESVHIPGRAFLGGRTFAGPPNSSGQLELQHWVRLDGQGVPRAQDLGGATPGMGFPGTEGRFAGDADLLEDSVLVFVPDADGDLATHERFPSNRIVRIEIETSVRRADGEFLRRNALACSSVGADVAGPEVLRNAPPNSTPQITPGAGELDVDPLTDIRVSFSEPLQPQSLGSLLGSAYPAPSSAMTIEYGPASSRVQAPFHIRPESIYDLSTWILEPAFPFPGTGPGGMDCSVFSRVDVVLNASQVEDLSGNLGVLGADTWFQTGEGPGLVNVPVAPAAIYIARKGAEASLSVLDLDGYGQGTGNPTYDPTYQTFEKGWSHYVLDPNLILQGASLRPPMTPPTCTVNGGSAGAFTLALDSNLDSRVLRAPIVDSVGEMMLGWPLDTVYHNGLGGSGCQAGGGNLCAITGKKLIDANLSTPTSLSPTPPGSTPTVSIFGGQNPISWAPHPNPPPLVFPPLCGNPYIGGREVTSIENPILQGRFNLLAPGDAFGDPSNGLPPSGSVAREKNQHFVGPGLPGQPLNSCLNYHVRQQIGHFLYVLDSARREVVVLNSNRMSVIDRIPVSDPTEMTMGPNLDLIAVSQQSSDTVTFIDIDPGSPRFHEVVHETSVGRSPRGLAWDPGNEDILVTNEGDNSVSVISAFSLEVRKTVRSHLAQPFDVAIAQRQEIHGFGRNVYFAFIANRNGRVAVFESGPNGVNGWGYDDIIGVVPMTFENPKRIALDPVTLRGGFWVLHESPLDASGQPTGESGGAVTQVTIDSGIQGPLPLGGLSTLVPQFRDMGFGVKVTLGPDDLTGVPVDLAFDDLSNLGLGPNRLSSFGTGTPLPMNGKSQIRTLGAPSPVNSPSFMMLAIPDSSEGSGAIDVVDLDGGGVRVDVDPWVPGVQSVEVPGVVGVSSFFEQ